MRAHRRRENTQNRAHEGMHEQRAGSIHRAKRGRAPHRRSAITVYPTAIVASEDRKRHRCEAMTSHTAQSKKDALCKWVMFLSENLKNIAKCEHRI